MKTIRLLYPDHVSGGLDTYYFGANLLQYILPQNPNQPVVKVDIIPPNSKENTVTNGIYAEEEVLSGIRDAQEKISKQNPDRIITIGGNCMVSLAPFDYLHGKYKNVGIIWIDAHPDVSTLNDGYPNAHAMVLGSLLGHGAAQLAKEIKSFIGRFDHILIHFDIDVLDEHFFHSTYFANPELSGDGSGGGKMTMEKLFEVLKLITENSDVVGFTVAEYLPFDEHNLQKMFSGIPLFTE